MCLPQKGQISPRKNTKGSNEVGEKALEALIMKTDPKFLEKRRIRNDLVLANNILYNQIGLEVTQLFKFSRRPGLKRSSLRILQQTGRARRRRNNFAYRVGKYWNRLPHAVASVPE